MRALSLAAALALGGVSTAVAQQIDSIVVVTHNVFDSAQTGSSFVFRVANALHVTTLPAVVRQELLFASGEPYDSALVDETLRNLRRRGIFRDVWVDTKRAGDRVNIYLHTADGWTTQLVLNANVTGDTLTWAAGVQELNFLGTGARVGVTYREEANRDVFTLFSGLERIGGTRFEVAGLYENLSDGEVGFWRLGLPFKAFGDRSAAELSGANRRQRVLRFRDGVLEQTFRRRQFHNAGALAYAPRASAAGYLRVGVAGQVKREEYLLAADSLLAIPDTVTGAVGVFAELARARFKVVTQYNGFAHDVDVDLSTRLRAEVWLAPAAFGYRATGVGPSVFVQAGAAFPSGFVVGVVRANGLFTSSGLDSGQVWGAFTIASQALPKQATVFHLEAGARDGTPPGEEFALGQAGGELRTVDPTVVLRVHGPGPRAFETNAFTGDRMVWAALEHRMFVIDEVLGLLGIGFAGFVDYGGAWFDDQPARLGGDVGFGLRFGSSRSAGPNVGRIDLSYRFGDGTEGKRWVVSFGRGFFF